MTRRTAANPSIRNVIRHAHEFITPSLSKLALVAIAIRWGVRCGTFGERTEAMDVGAGCRSLLYQFVDHKAGKEKTPPDYFWGAPGPGCHAARGAETLGTGAVGPLRSVDPLVELLDRQADFVLRQTDSQAFLIQVESFLRALKTELRLGAHLHDVLQEVADVVGVMEEVDAELSSELLELRRELVALRPEADDSDVAAPTDAGPRRTTALAIHHGTLAFFDEHARADPRPFNADGEGGRAKTLLSILQRKDAGFLARGEGRCRRGC